MTHTLHRQGDEESLGTDYVLLMLPAPGYNAQNSAGKLKKFLDIVLEYEPVNFGVVKKGNRFTSDVEELANAITDGNCVHAVFTSREQQEAALKDVKDADLGISVTATGLFEGTRQSCRNVGLTPHTVQYSLGIWGDQGKYRPSEPILNIITMCGHGLVPAALAERLAEEVYAGEETLDSAAAELARLCGCGVFNHRRASDLLHEAVHELRADGAEAGHS